MPRRGKIRVAALDGELAMPCTGNSPQPGRIPPPRFGLSGPFTVESVEGLDLRSPGLRTPSDPEGSSGKEEARGCRSHPDRSLKP